jgi:hypothetical protein
MDTRLTTLACSSPADAVLMGFEAGRAVFQWPFDTLRAQYARAVRAGLVQNSVLASRDFENTLGALERLTLGPLARRV